MKVIAGLVLATCGASAAYAGGIERTTQSAMILYSEGNRLELSYGSAMPDITGTDVLGNSISNVASDFSLPSFGFKMDLNDQVAVALIYDKPWGADITYAGSPASTMLGGTMAKAETDTLTALAKYQFNENVSAFAGVRFQRASGEVTLAGLGYGAISGYNVVLGEASGTGYVIGAAYEIPDIAMRVALTYNSAITHDFPTTENIAAGESTTTSKTPPSWNLEFQTGIAPDTLLMGSIRYVKHSEFQIDPVAFTAATGSGLVDLEDTTTYTLGVGRRFNDKLSGSISVSYEAETDPLVSPLAPSNGKTGIALGLSYKVNEQFEVAGGVSQVWLGDATPETADTARATFDGNTATAVGLKFTYLF